MTSPVLQKINEHGHVDNVDTRTALLQMISYGKAMNLVMNPVIIMISMKMMTMMRCRKGAGHAEDHILLSFKPFVLVTLVKALKAA